MVFQMVIKVVFCFLYTQRNINHIDTYMSILILYGVNSISTSYITKLSLLRLKDSWNSFTSICKDLSKNALGLYLN